MTKCITLATDYARRQPVAVYDLMNMWPSLCIGSVLQDVENYSVFYDAMRADIPASNHAFAQWIVQRVTSDAHAHMRLEMSGLGKIFGHLIIDMERSITAWIEKGTVMKPGKQDIGKRCSEMFKLILCRRFYEERNRWPPLIFSG